MTGALSRTFWILGIGLALGAAPARAATFLGLETGDEIDTIGFTIGTGGAVWNDTTNEFDITASLDDITTTTAEVLLDIQGGDLDIRLDLDSESLLHVVGNLLSYTATFSGRAGVADVNFFSPTGGPAPEQDGRLLITGEILNLLTVQVSFDPTTNTVSQFTASGVFGVGVAGDAVFRQAFGNIGSLANVFATSQASTPSLPALLADGFLFSVRDTNIAACLASAPFSACAASINGLQNFSASGNGEIVPQSAAAFVPEPGTFTLLGAGLVGLMAFARRARR